MKEEAPEAGRAEDLVRYAECWNAERFFDAHETLEPRWIATRDPGLRGLIQLAAAFHHLQRGNLAGARTTLGRAISRLTDPGSAPCGIDQAQLARYAGRVLARLDKTPAVEIIASRPRL